MKIYRLEKTQHLPISTDEAWNFVSDPKNLIKITPKKLNLVVTNHVPDKMHPGMIVTYRVKPLLNIPMNWVTEITHVHAPHFFVDEQRFGPYGFWHHQHHIEEGPNGNGTLMRDIIHYGIKPNIFSGILNNLVVRQQLEDIFEHRFSVFEEMFGNVS